MLRAVSDGVIRRQVQAVVIGLVVLVFTAAAALAPGPLADVSAPLERAFAAQHGAEVTATAKASPAQLAATTGLAEVTAAAGPFPETTVTATMLMPPSPGQSGPYFPAQQMTVVGRASRRVTPADTARSTGAALIAALPHPRRWRPGRRRPGSCGWRAARPGSHRPSSSQVSSRFRASLLRRRPEDLRRTARGGHA